MLLSRTRGATTSSSGQDLARLGVVAASMSFGVVAEKSGRYVGSTPDLGERAAGEIVVCEGWARKEFSSAKAEGCHVGLGAAMLKVSSTT